MENYVTCAVCERTVEIGAGYVVRMDIMADPELPPMTGDEITQGNLNAAIAAVIEEARNLSAEDLQDGVHRRSPICIGRTVALAIGRSSARPPTRRAGVCPSRARAKAQAIQ